MKAFARGKLSRKRDDMYEGEDGIVCVVCVCPSSPALVREQGQGQEESCYVNVTGSLYPSNSTRPCYSVRKTYRKIVDKFTIGVCVPKITGLFCDLLSY